MTTLLKICIFLALPVLFASLQASELPDADDYAYGWAVNPDRAADLYQIQLPLEVYQSATDPALRDLGVYNRAGQPVPRGIVRPAEERTVAETSVPLVLLPLYSGQDTHAQSLNLLVKRNAEETTVSLESFDQPSDFRQPDKKLTSYIVDLGNHPQLFDALDLVWPESNNSFIGHLNVHGSDDLQNWRLIGSGSIAFLSRDGERIERRRINLTDNGENDRYQYLRLTWRDVSDDWSLAQVTGIKNSHHVDTTRESLKLAPSGRDKADGGYIFDTSGPILVDRVGLQLPGDNVTVRASIYAWSETKAVAGARAINPHWRRVASGHFYHLRGGGNAIISDSLTIPLQRFSRWKVVIDKGSTDLALHLELGWRPEKLLFVAQGEGPFQVVTGRAADAAEGFPQQQMISDATIHQLAQQHNLIGSAELAARIELAGPGRLQFADPPLWGRWLIWAGLIGGVMLVGFMALSLIRELKDADQS